MTLFVSSGEIFIILLFILIFFGSDKIPEFVKIMGKGVREVKKATDDIKRELEDSSSGVMDDIKSISSDLNNTFTNDIANPVQKTVSDTTNVFNDFQEQLYDDYYYDNQDNIDGFGNEYQDELASTPPLPAPLERESSAEIPATTEINSETES